MLHENAPAVVWSSGVGKLRAISCPPADLKCVLRGIEFFFFKCGNGNGPIYKELPFSDPQNDFDEQINKKKSKCQNQDVAPSLNVLPTLI